jgi:DNA-binding transcriptional LysR family regulator
VSYTVRQLEEALGVELFDRGGHRAVLTPVGRALLDEGRGLLAHARRVEELASGFQGTWEPRLEIVVDGILPMQPILRALKRLADDGVPTRIQLRVEFLGGVQDRFERDEADVMLVKDYDRSATLAEHPLPAVPCVLVVAAEHAIARAGAASLSLADLQEHVELTVHDSSEQRRFVDARIFGSPRVFYLSDFGTKKEAIAMGLGYGWMPEYLVKEELARGALVEVRYEAGSRYELVPLLVHPRARPLGRAGRALLALLAGG